MKLYITEKRFSWTDKFSIWDEKGADKYFVQGELIALGKNLHIYDRHNKEIAIIKQRVMSMTPKFDIFIGDQQVATMTRKFSLSTTKYDYVVDNLGWNIHGNIWFNDHRVNCNGSDIITIKKSQLMSGDSCIERLSMMIADSYEINIADGVNEVIAVAVAIIIDSVIEDCR